MCQFPSTKLNFTSGFINSTVRLFLYIFVGYIIFRFATFHQTDPWCLGTSCDNGVNFSGDSWNILVVQLFTTFFGYIFAWVACTMTLGRYSMGLALFLATPVSLAAYYIHTYGKLSANVSFFPLFHYTPVFSDAYPWAPVILIFLWFGQWIGIGIFVFHSMDNYTILAKDWDMFLTPYYDGVFFEQHMLLNRQVEKHLRRAPPTSESPDKRKAIFICTPMYQENDKEMEQLLHSIKRIAEYKKNPKIKDIYESHIFFDGALVGTQLEEFGIQLLSLLHKTLGVNPEDFEENWRTPYGLCLKYILNKGTEFCMPFSIHFKDKHKVKPKKRWSQVMYMNYIIEHRIKKDERLKEMQKENIFILATDADVDFTAESAVVLLDMLVNNPNVGAVCARTHPVGSGPLYWYQVFDYLVGHWFQKPAEHLLGCVLCSPGCFSVFRCSALEEVLETYSSEATSGMEFLMKDMGEDRWLCTLLIEKGWRLEYCAVSNDKTHCPPDFRQFYAQRRRWTASTLANLSLLIKGIRSIPENNDTISVLFILFQALIVFSTIISPATVILVITSGLQSAFKFSNGLTLFIIFMLVIVSILYGAVCLFASPKTQIDVAKILSIFFAIVMIIVITGIFRDVILGIFPEPQLTFLTAANCTQHNHTSKTFQDCEASARYLTSLPNTLSYTFKFPVSTSVLYLGLFAFTFLVAAILHPTEFFSVFHCIWYLLALPSGYLFLPIYSAANLDSQSWGTREKEKHADEDKGLLGWLEYSKKVWQKLVLCFTSKKSDAPHQDPIALQEEESVTPRKYTALFFPAPWQIPYSGKFSRSANFRVFRGCSFIREIKIQTFQYLEDRRTGISRTRYQSCSACMQTATRWMQN